MEEGSAEGVRRLSAEILKARRFGLLRVFICLFARAAWGSFAGKGCLCELRFLRCGISGALDKPKPSAAACIIPS